MTKGNFWESRKFKIIIGAINGCLIIALIAYMLFMHFNVEPAQGRADNGWLDVSAKSYSDEEAAHAMEEAATGMVSVYGDLIKGASADLGDGLTMKFGYDGTYEGFFDANNMDVKDYTYVVVNPDGQDGGDYEAAVVIYNKDKGQCVQYKLTFDDAGGMELYNTESDAYIALDFQ